MPKEYISSEPQERGSVAVSWGRDHGTIQISVAGPVGWRNPLLDVIFGEGVVSDVEQDNGLDWFFTPSRNEINKLIRVLRTARDQAFGRDE